MTELRTTVFLVGGNGGNSAKANDKKHYETESSVLKNAVVFLYTVCPRRNVPDFGRAFLVLNYTDITQNTQVQS
jgi:hypothetical protein